jgi:signal transduction histidine kinase
MPAKRASLVGHGEWVVDEVSGRARAILEQPLPIARTSGERRLGALVEDKASEWQSLVTVTMAIDPSAAQIDGLMADHVGAIVEEGIANAVHHGQAHTVDVRIASADDQLTVPTAIRVD